MKLKDIIFLDFFKRKFKKQTKRIKPKQLITIDRNPIQFNRFENPKVSIIIPFYNQEIYTWNCLQYLNKNLTDKYSYEIILIDDNSSEAYDFTNATGITIVKNESNLGFLKNINKGINISKGEFIYLLNNDTEVYENFLEELFYVFENHKNVGAVGSMLLNADQSLQEAGSVFMKDFTIHQIVRNREPFYPEVNYIRKVDYCSGCSLLFKKHKDNGDLNLFDEQFAPAYFEETDLCFDLKYNQNKNIYYTPFSKVLHYNGITYNDKSKVNQESNNRKEILFKTNKEKFYNKWREAVDNIQSECVEERIVEINNNKSIVFFNDCFPEFDKDSGSNRLKEIMNVFVERGFNVSFIYKNTSIKNSYIKTYQKMGINVYYKIYDNKKYESFISNFCASANYVWIYGPNTFERYFEKIKPQFLKAKFVYDMVDIHHLRFKRATELVDNGNNTNYENYLKYEKIELEAAQNSDYVITISDDEKEFMKTKCDENKLITISNIHYTKIKKEQIADFNKRKDIVFIGSTHHPNVDAIYFLYKEIMPIVWAVLPEIKVNVVGNVNTVIKDIIDERIVFHGFVSDVEELFSNSKLMVAPLRIGAGVKGKIGQAFEFYLPVVTTTIGSEGMFLKDQENVLVADDAKLLAESIIELYRNEEIWRKLSLNSEKSLYPFSTEKVNEIIEKSFDVLI